jgi:hypothetical protein
VCLSSWATISGHIHLSGKVALVQLAYIIECKQFVECGGLILHSECFVICLSSLLNLFHYLYWVPSCCVPSACAFRIRTLKRIIDLIM